jgi:hypothetical protein
LAPSPKKLQSRPPSPPAPTRRPEGFASLGLSVRYQLSVLNADGSLAFERPAKNNLILDAGLDLPASNVWAALTTYARVGTGTTPVKRDSGAITFSRSGTTVTASANFFEAADVGRLLKFDSGEEMYVTAFIDAQTVTVDTSGTLGASEGTIWYVNQTVLVAQTKSTSTYGTNSGDNGSSYDGVNTAYIFKRTYIFSAESGAVTYNEIGWAPTPSGNLFGRDIITGGISLVAGQQLKVVVELTVRIRPNTATAYTNVVTGWTQDGQCSVEWVDGCFATVLSDGNVIGSGSALDAVDGGGGRISLSTLASALIPPTQSDPGNEGNIATKSVSLSTYITGSRQRDKFCTFAISEGNSGSIRSLILGVLNGTNKRVFRVLLNAAETKDSNHTLELRFRLTWSRILVN